MVSSMKMLTQVQYSLSGLNFSITTCWYAKHRGTWELSLNYHKLSIWKERPIPEDPNRTALDELLYEKVHIQIGDISDAANVLMTFIGNLGMVVAVIDTLRKILQVLTGVIGISTFAEWVISDQASKDINTIDQYAKNAVTQLELIKGGARIVRSRHRWRRKSIEGTY